MSTPATATRAELRWFGLILLALFGLVGGLVLWRLDALRVAAGLWGFGLALAVVYYSVPPLQRPLYHTWMRAVQPIGWLVSHALLAIVYYAMVTPLGLSMRLFGRDKLERGFDKEAATYWTEHDPGGDTARYFRQT